MTRRPSECGGGGADVLPTDPFDTHGARRR
jgi:hypothetical protein